MSLRFKSRILDHLAHRNYLPILTNEVARQLRVAEDDEAEFLDTVRELAESGLLEIGKDEKLRLPRMPEEIEGVIKLTPRGMGFLKTQVDYREGDLFIPQGETKDAVSGDRVRVKVVRRGDRWNRGFGATPTGARDDIFGRVLEVLSRGRSRFAGVLVKRGREWLVEPDGRAIRDPIVVRDPGAKNAKEGDKDVVDILLWPEEGALAEGVILEVLGETRVSSVEQAACYILSAHPEHQKAGWDWIDADYGNWRAFKKLLRADRRYAFYYDEIEALATADADAAGEGEADPGGEEPRA